MRHGGCERQRIDKCNFESTLCSNRMAGTTLAPISVRPERRPLTVRRRTAILGTTAVAVVVALMLATVIAPWSPILHLTCQVQGSVYQQADVWIPDVVVNSPYGGYANGTGLLPWTFPGAGNGPPPGPGARFGWGTEAANGTAFGAFFEVNVSLFRLGNATLLGPGANTRCSSPFQIVLQNPSQHGGTAAQIAKPTNQSDTNEAENATLFAGSSNPVQSPSYFNNSFTTSNWQSVSTCGKSGTKVVVTSGEFEFELGVVVGGKPVRLSYVLPVIQDFSYSFPTNYGTWQVDNLSAPGGSGGGWAFNYLGPCS